MDLDLVGFSLKIAGEILVGLIVDLAKGQIREIFGPKIKQEVNAIVKGKLSQFDYEDSTIQELTSKVLDEIKKLATQDPDLIISPDGETIELKKLPGPQLPQVDNLDLEVEKRITRLKSIINQRRKELGLPVEPEVYQDSEWYERNPKAENSGDPPNPDTKQQDHEELQSPEEWIDVEPPKPQGRWAKRMEESRRRVELIRAEVDISDDE